MSPEEERFMANVREARENGYEFVCAECGVGIHDDADEHEGACSRNPGREEHLALVARWAAKQSGRAG